MAEEVKSENGKIWLQSQYGKKGDIETTVKMIEVQTFPAGVHPAHVSVERGLTINLGNYESARLSCVVQIPCVVEEIEDAIRHATTIAEAEVREQSKEFSGNGK